MVRESSEVVPVGEERRALQLFNPGLDGRWATTNTMIAAVQVLLPGETARAHRHTPTAIRFIMEGEGAYTAVDGERVYMAPGDLVLTPSWAWHDHGNETGKPVVWMDGLDVPLVQFMNAMFFQLYEDAREFPLTKPQRVGAAPRPRQPQSDLGEDRQVRGCLPRLLRLRRGEPRVVAGQLGESGCARQHRVLARHAAGGARRRRRAPLQLRRTGGGTDRARGEAPGAMCWPPRWPPITPGAESGAACEVSQGASEPVKRHMGVDEHPRRPSGWRKRLWLTV